MNGELHSVLVLNADRYVVCHLRSPTVCGFKLSLVFDTSAYFGVQNEVKTQQFLVPTIFCSFP